MRLFVALEVPPEVRETLTESAGRLRAELPAARWVPATNLHLTLRFLGETPSERMSAVGEALAGCFRTRRPFRLELAEAGCFPPRRPARVAWVGFAPCPELLELQEALEKALRDRLGLAAEGRPYHPHLTLARPRRPWPRWAVDRWHAAFRDHRSSAFRVAEGHLMRSHLGPAGARYESLEAFPLAGTGGAGV